MECNKPSLVENRQPYKTLQIVDGGQYFFARLVKYTLEAENKRLISQKDFSLIDFCTFKAVGGTYSNN